MTSQTARLPAARWMARRVAGLSGALGRAVPLSRVPDWRDGSLLVLLLSL